MGVETLIKTYTLEQSEEWEKVVRSFHNYDVYYLPGYAKAFELNGDGNAELIYYLSQDESTKGINVIMKRDIHDFKLLSDVTVEKMYDIVTPYGYGGWLIEGEGIEQLVIEYEKWAKQNRIVSEFVRFHPILNNHLDILYDETYLGDTVCIDTTSPTVIWSNFSGRNRGKIRKAVKLGQRVYWSRDPRIIDDFMDIYRATMDKDSAEDYYYFKKNFYESVMEELKYNALFFYSMLGQEITAIALFLFCNGQMHYHLSASRQEYRNYQATNLVIAEAAMWAWKNGYKILHLGGGLGAKHDNLYMFKKLFNKNKDIKFYIGKKIYNEEAYYKLVEKRKQEVGFNENTSYFPVYRCLARNIDSD